jgi:hypothetical protein
MSDGDLTAEFEAVRDELIGKLSGEEREMAVRLLEHTVNVGMLKASGQDTSMQEPSDPHDPREPDVGGRCRRSVPRSSRSSNA